MPEGKEKMHVDMPTDLYEWVRKQAAKEDRSMASLVRVAVVKYRKSVET